MGEATTVVIFTNSCGHQLVEVASCLQHLADLVGTYGVAPQLYRCEVCGQRTPLRFVATRDLL